MLDKKVRFLQDIILMKEKNRKNGTFDSESLFTFTKDTWVADSETSSHIANDDSGLEKSQDPQ